jgi:hypothetical protein
MIVLRWIMLFPPHTLVHAMPVSRLYRPSVAGSGCARLAVLRLWAMRDRAPENVSAI